MFGRPGRTHYPRSDDHSVNFGRNQSSDIYRILNIALIITCFLFGSRAGLTLNQQFGFPIG